MNIFKKILYKGSQWTPLMLKYFHTYDGYIQTYIWMCPCMSEAMKNVCYRLVRCVVYSLLLVIYFFLFIFFALSLVATYTFTHMYSVYSFIRAYKPTDLQTFCVCSPFFWFEFLFLNLRQPKLHWAGFSDPWLLYDLYFSAVVINIIVVVAFVAAADDVFFFFFFSEITKNKENTQGTHVDTHTHSLTLSYPMIDDEYDSLV